MTKGNGISPNIRSQGEWIRNIVNTDGCTGCHQMGGPATRTIPPSILSQFEDTKAAWDRRIQAGQAGGGMSARFTQVGRARALGDVRRLDRPHREGRAAGRRRRRVRRASSGTSSSRCGTGRIRRSTCTTRSRATSATRRSTPNGPIYGALEESGDYFPVIDPKTNTASQIKLAPRDADTPSSADQPPAAPSPYWGDEAIWNSKTTVHSFAMDKQGRVWAAARVRKPQTPAWCQAGSDHPSAKLLPINQAQRGLIMYDPKTKQITTIDTCFTWGHVNFDDNDVLWSSFGPAGVEGWFDVEDVGQDARREGGAGLERVRRSTTTATASATPTPSRISPPIPPRTSGSPSSSTATRRRRTARCGDPCRACPARWCASFPARIRPRPR